MRSWHGQRRLASTWWSSPSYPAGPETIPSRPPKASGDGDGQPCSSPWATTIEGRGQACPARAERLRRCANLDPHRADRLGERRSCRVGERLTDEGEQAV